MHMTEILYYWNIDTSFFVGTPYLLQQSLAVTFQLEKKKSHA